MRTLKDVEVEGKVVLLRADFNVPMRKGLIEDDSRITKTLPTIHHLLEHGAKQVLILTHFGRPKGQVVEEFRVKPIHQRLVKLLEPDGISVGYAQDCLMEHLPTQRVVLLENTRFYKEETKNDEEFARKLAHHADLFVFDAFGTAHRDHASTTGVANFIPVSCFGLLMEKELEVLGLQRIPKPFMAIIGAAKVKDKIPVMEALLPRVDKLLLGGAIVFTFLKALGHEVGSSLVEESELDRAKAIYDRYRSRIVLPVDFVISESPDSHDIHTVAIDKIPKGMMGLDIGDESVALFERTLKEAGTIFWNGPLGMFEVPPFDAATNAVAKYLSRTKQITIVGGGDTEEAIIEAGVAKNFTHVSTGGGAALEYISGKGLIVVEKLSAME